MLDVGSSMLDVHSLLAFENRFGKIIKGKHSIMELEGLGADIWEGIDAQEYVRKERESWD